MAAHMKNNHITQISPSPPSSNQSPTVIPPSPQLMQPSIEDAISAVQAYSAGGSKAEQLDKILLYWIVRNVQPFSMLRNATISEYETNPDNATILSSTSSGTATDSHATSFWKMLTNVYEQQSPGMQERDEVSHYLTSPLADPKSNPLKLWEARDGETWPTLEESVQIVGPTEGDGVEVSVSGRASTPEPGSCLDESVVKSVSLQLLCVSVELSIATDCGPAMGLYLRPDEPAGAAQWKQAFIDTQPGREVSVVMLNRAAGHVEKNLKSVDRKRNGPKFRPRTGSRRSQAWSPEKFRNRKWNRPKFYSWIAPEHQVRPVGAILRPPPRARRPGCGSKSQAQSHPLPKTLGGRSQGREPELTKLAFQGGLNAFLTRPPGPIRGQKAEQTKILSTNRI
ncbi:hypothetical protein ACLKA7_000847 [Drosophila subpalustris]